MRLMSKAKNENGMLTEYRNSISMPKLARYSLIQRCLFVWLFQRCNVVVAASPDSWPDELWWTG